MNHEGTPKPAKLGTFTPAVTTGCPLAYSSYCTGQFYCQSFCHSCRVAMSFQNFTIHPVCFADCFVYMQQRHVIVPRAR